MHYYHFDELLKWTESVGGRIVRFQGVSVTMKMRIVKFVIMCWYFFFQAEDGIRDRTVTGVQTCALPIFRVPQRGRPTGPAFPLAISDGAKLCVILDLGIFFNEFPKGVKTLRTGFGEELTRKRSEERRVGKECRCRWWRDA